METCCVTCFSFSFTLALPCRFWTTSSLHTMLVSGSRPHASRQAASTRRTSCTAPSLPSASNASRLAFGSLPHLGGSNLSSRGHRLIPFR
eukprot:scaffold110_cov315-Pavlova_lutheri.AAC.55